MHSLPCSKDEDVLNIIKAPKSMLRFTVAKSLCWLELIFTEETALSFTAPSGSSCLFSKRLMPCYTFHFIYGIKLKWSRTQVISEVSV